MCHLYRVFLFDEASLGADEKNARASRWVQNGNAIAELAYLLKLDLSPQSLENQGGARFRHARTGIVVQPAPHA